MSSQEIVALNIRKLDADLRSRFKALCAIMRIGMEDAVIKMMEEAVKNNSIPGVPDTVISGRLPRV